jgi:hypothetical protein
MTGTPSTLPTLLRWLPDETLFSLSSRHHRFWGHSNPAQTSKLLFGRARAGFHHDLPNALAEFQQRTGGCYGNAEELANSRTLLAFYRPFLDGAVLDQARQVMAGPSVAHLKFALGLLTSRFRANHPLKACKSCMAGDVAEHGWAYWHIDHQFPGVWVCPRHGELLWVSTVKSTGVERFLWHLPAASQLETSLDQPDSLTLGAFSRLAHTAMRLTRADIANGEIAVSRAQAVLRARMAARGWVTAGGNLRLREAAGDYAAHCMPLRHVAEFRELPQSADEANVHLGRLLRPLRSGTHPLRLIAAVDWLFDDPEEFLQALRAPSVPLLAGESETNAVQSPALHHDNRRDRLAELLRAGQSVTAAARMLGVDVGTAMAWAAAVGFTNRRRPKVVTDEVRAEMVNDLREGLDKTQAAERYSVSVVTVTRLLRTEIGLHKAWGDARYLAAQAAARREWSELCETQPTLGVKWIRTLCPGAYAWLYRHDREWLREHAPGAGAQHRVPANRGIRWDERDLHLSQAVREAALTLSRTQPGKALRLWQLYQRLPELKPKLSRLDRLPLTKRALEVALQPPGHRLASPGWFD